LRGRQLSPRPSDASPTARRLPRTAPPVTGRLRSRRIPLPRPPAPRPGHEHRVECASRREEITASGPVRRALSGPVPPASTVLRIRAARGRACSAPLTPETSTGPAGLTARARPKARPGTRAANLLVICPLRARLMGSRTASGGSHDQPEIAPDVQHPRLRRVVPRSRAAKPPNKALGTALAPDYCINARGVS
jgi:hypothetical protein